MKKDLIRITSNFSIYEDDRLGNGQFGTVYRGYFSDGRIDVAVKIIEKDLFKKYTGLYYREIEVLKKLNRLPAIDTSHVVRLFGHAVYNQEGYLFFQLCKGDLRKIITKGNAQPQATVVKYFKQIMVGLCFLHRNQVIHRDLKQDNILVDNEGNLKITDFGLSKEFEVGNEMKMTEKIGSYLYQAPEVRTHHYDKRSDVWSAGLILYELLTDLPWKDIQNENDVDRRNFNIRDGSFKLSFPGMDPIWERLLKKMLTYDYQKRPTSAQILEEYLIWLNEYQGKSLEKQVMVLPEPAVSLFKTFTQYQKRKEEEVLAQAEQQMNRSQKKASGKSVEQQKSQKALMQQLGKQNHFPSVRNYIQYLDYYHSYKHLIEITNKRIIDIIISDPTLKPKYRSFFILTICFLAESVVYMRYKELLQEMEKLKGGSKIEKELDEKQRKAYQEAIEIKRKKFDTYVHDYDGNFSKKVTKLVKYQQEVPEVPHYNIVFNYLANIQHDKRQLAFDSIVEHQGIILQDIDYDLSREAIDKMKETEVTVMFLCKRLREITEQMSEGLKIMSSAELKSIKKALREASLPQMIANLKAK